MLELQYYNGNSANSAKKNLSLGFKIWNCSVEYQMSSYKDEENIIICIPFLQFLFYHFYWKELFCRSFSVSDNYSHFGICCWRSHRSLFGNGILLPKLFWPTVRKNCSSAREKICKIFEITRTIYSNSGRSEQFLVTECFFNLLLEVSQIW